MPQVEPNLVMKKLIFFSILLLMIVMFSASLNYLSLFQLWLRKTSINMLYNLIPKSILRMSSFEILEDTEGISKPTGENNKLPVLESALAIAVSLAICKIGTCITSFFGIKGGNLPCMTAIAVALATIFPSYFTKLAPAGEAMALILMQVV
jgi:Protein of unknown function (DUF819)